MVTSARSSSGDEPPADRTTGPTARNPLSLPEQKPCQQRKTLMALLGPKVVPPTNWAITLQVPGRGLPNRVR